MHDAWLFFSPQIFDLFSVLVHALECALQHIERCALRNFFEHSVALCAQDAKAITVIA